MDWSAVWTELPKAVGPFVGTVVGGLLAIIGGIIGGFVGQYLTHRYTRAREAEKLIREKAEQLIHELYAHRYWLDALHSAVVFHQKEHDTPSPLDRAYAFQSLYFPKLRQHLDAMRAVEIQIVHFSRVELERQFEDRQAWFAQKEQSIAKWKLLYEAYIKALEAAVAAIVTTVEKQGVLKAKR
jgi:hypothetical protein